MTMRSHDDFAIHSARSLFNWFLNPSDDDKAVERAINSDVLRNEFGVGGGIDAPLWLKRSYQSADFPQQREKLLGEWKSVFNSNAPLTVDEARAFLKDWAGSVDHKLIYNHSVLAGITHARKEFPSSDYVTTYYGDRSATTLHFTTHGAMDYIAGNAIHATRGDLVLIAPDANVHYGRSRQAVSWLHFWVVFEPEPTWQELLQWPLRTHGIRLLNIASESEITRLENLFQQLLDCYADEPGLTDRLMKNLVEQILIRAQSQIQSNKVVPTDPRVLKASQYLIEHISDVSSVAEVARECNLSESRLAHLFQQHLGMGIQQYRNTLRLQRAKKLLTTTGESVARIAGQVGYDDPAQFSKFFAKHLQCSPRAFRKLFTSTKGVPADLIGRHEV